jgi:hypothetical protein
VAHYIVTQTVDYENDRIVSGLAYTAVPPGDNSAGIPWSDVVRSFQRYRNRRFGTQLEASVLVDAATQTGLNNGTLFEWRWKATFPQSHTNPQAIAAIESAINAQEAAMISKLSGDLRYWGFEGDS